MSTNSRIAIKRDDGTITAVYCHWDGYPEYNGRILCRYYETLEKAEALVALGGLSSIRPRLAPDEGETHTFLNAKSDITIAYYRDRGEIFDSLEYPNSKEYYGSTYDYRYMFFSGRWFINGGEVDTWVPLEL